MKASSRWLERRQRSLENLFRLLHEKNEKVTLEYGEEKTVVGRSERMLVKALLYSFWRMTCISLALLKLCLQEIGNVDYSFEHLRRNCTGFSGNVWQAVLTLIANSLKFH